MYNKLAFPITWRMLDSLILEENHISYFWESLYPGNVTFLARSSNVYPVTLEILVLSRAELPAWPWVRGPAAHGNWCGGFVLSNIYK